MLIVTRRVGERIVLGDGVEVWVAKIGRKSVRLAVNAPAGHVVLRGELWDAVALANRSAASAGVGDVATAAGERSPASPAPDVTVETEDARGGSGR